MHPRLDGTQVHAAYGFPRTGAGIVLLLLGCWGAMSLAYSLPGIIRALNQSCGACDLGAFESPLKPLGRQPANGSTVASPDPRDVSGLVSAGSPPTVAAALELRSGGAWLDSDHLLNAIQLPRFEFLANRPADALGPLVFGPVVFGPLAFGPWHLAPDWSAAVPRMSLTWPMETWSPAAEAGRWPAPVAPGATYQSNDRVHGRRPNRMAGRCGSIRFAPMVRSWRGPIWSGISRRLKQRAASQASSRGARRTATRRATAGTR